MYEWASKQSPDPKNSISTGPRTPVLKFLDPPLRDTISPKALTFEAVNAVDMCKFAPIHRDGDDLV